MFGRKKKSTAELTEALCSQLTQALGDRLLTLIQFFPFQVSGQEADAERAQLLILLDRVDFKTLSECSDAFAGVPGSESLAPRILSQDELLASTDVFPLTFLEMKHNYRLLAGKDLLAELEISNSHLRLRCEQELRNLLLRMQSNLVLRKHSANDLFVTLRASYASFQRCLYATEILANGGVVPKPNSVNAKSLEADRDVMKRTQEICQTTASAGAEAIVEIYGFLMEEVRRICNAVDELAEVFHA